MELAQLSFYPVSMPGMGTVDAFDINTRYHGYTWDHNNFNVYDEVAQGYTSYDEIALDQLLKQNFFGEATGNPVNQNSSNDSGISQLPFLSNDAQWIKPVFIGGVIIMMLYIATRKGK